MRLTNCVACGSDDIDVFLDLGVQPLANSYHKGEQLPAYPLQVARCVNCTHSQLTVVAPPDELFRNYLYVSGTTTTLHDDFRDFAEKATAEFEERTGRKPRVLDIACNDGTLLEYFSKLGCDVVGVDPAENLAIVTKEKGLKVVCDYWTNDVAAKVGPVDIIIAMNVVAHVADPLAFLKTAQLALEPGGRIYVQTSQANWLDNGEFDCVYHEHISYFSKESFAVLARKAGLRILETSIVPIHGGSMRVTLDAPHNNITKNSSRIAQDLQATVAELRKKGYAVVGYGAAAKGNTLLNFAGVDLDWIVDDNPLKCGHYTPGRNIIIKPATSIAEENVQKLAVLLLAWNFEEEIRRRVDLQRPNAKTIYVSTFPKVRIL